METALSHTRRRIPRGLPQLSGFTRSTDASDASPERADEIAELLRAVAVKSRNDHLQRFYSIRFIAEHFHISPAMVSRIYHRLEAEGLLRLVWGSKTLLEPAESGQNGQCHCVGIPVDLCRFMAAADYRERVLLLQIEMWNHEIDEHLLFFRAAEEEVVTLCKRSHHPRIDTVVWLFPRAACRQTLLRLHDLGLRVFCLSEKPMPQLQRCYTISDRSSIRKIIRKQVLRI